MKIQFIKADPAGNITLFVLTPVAREERTEIAGRLMARPELAAEQVGFVLPPLHGALGRMEMAGGEFCGNATRSFGMLVSKYRGRTPQVSVEVSGCAHPVTVTVDWEEGTALSQMPLPGSITPVTVMGIPSVLVDLGGIVHLVAESVEPDMEFFRQAEPLLRSFRGADAYGVLFTDRERNRMVPLVKVPAAGTTVWEGSCGSGTLAAVCALSRDETDGTSCLTLTQPAGVVTASVVREHGRITAASIGGPVTLGEVRETEL